MNIKNILKTRKALLVAVGLATASFAQAQNIVKGDYGYLYCHMSDKGEWTAYAVSRDGYNYQDIIDGEPIFDQKALARIEGGTACKENRFYGCLRSCFKDAGTFCFEFLFARNLFLYKIEFADFIYRKTFAFKIKFWNIKNIKYIWKILL